MPQVMSSDSSGTQNSQFAKILDLLERILARESAGPFVVRLWNGAEWRHGQEEPRFILELKHPGALRSLIWRPSELSLGEAYIYEDFDIHGDLEACFALADHLTSRSWSMAERVRLGGKLLRLRSRRTAGRRDSTVQLRGRLHSQQRDAQAVRHHYDLSNDFYRLWLDERMVYSCAYFQSADDSLDEAQLRKLDYICRKLRLRPGDKLLDIGCGWGGLILHAAARHGVAATGITLSQPQADWAEQRIREAGLAQRCRVEVCDYRDLPEELHYDKLVSVGMFEHVGEAHLPEYFRKAHRLLKAGGVFLNHGITASMAGLEKTGPSFIDKYVFPDGDLLPLSTSLRVAEQCGFEVRDVECLREHYTLTLRHWVSRLAAARALAVSLTDALTYRIWRLYMSGSAYGFATGRIGLYQSLLVKSGHQETGLPLTRGDWYGNCPNHRE